MATEGLRRMFYNPTRRGGGIHQNKKKEKKTKK